MSSELKMIDYKIFDKLVCSFAESFGCEYVSIRRDYLKLLLKKVSKNLLSDKSFDEAENEM